MSEKHEAQFQSRNSALQHTIDVLASYDPTELEKHGKLTEIADEHDLEVFRVRYVLDRWADLVRHRRNQNANPLDPEAVKAAYDDETLAAMADRGPPVADGAGEVTVSIEFPLDEAFRAIKLLPGDLGMRVFTSVLEQADELPRADLRRILD